MQLSKFFTVNDLHMPHAIWIWDMPSISLVALLIHTNPVKAVEWDSKQFRQHVTGYY